MKYLHHQLEYEIDDEWLAEAGVLDFKLSRDCYLADSTIVSDKDIITVPIESVEPSLNRAKSRGVFCDDKESGDSAKQRVVRILRCLLADQGVEPVKVVFSKDKNYKYKLVEGCHRFHCAHALGFKSVPATEGFDTSDPHA